MAIPQNVTVTNIKPQNLSVDKTQAVFQNQSITWDQPNTQWDQPNTPWGGSDRKQGGNPVNIGVDK